MRQQQKRGRRRQGGEGVTTEQGRKIRRPSALWLVTGLAMTILPPAAARADKVIGNWEDANDGWIDWGSGQIPVDQSAKFSYTTTGATLGSKALQVSQNGWGQNLSIRLQQDYSPALDLRDDWLEYTQFAIDVTVPAQTTGGWTEVYQLWLNAENYGFVGQSSAVPVRQWGWGASGGGAQSATLTFDYSALLDGDAGNGEIKGNPGWLEYILATNGADADHGVVIFDNARLTSPKLAVDINGGSSPNTGHPNQRGFRRWDNLPTSGQNGDPAQNGYPVDTATQTFNTSTVASGNVQATLSSRDVGGTQNAPTYLAGANLNSHDMSIPGRDLDDSGNFTPARDSVYRDRVIAETGIGSNGTNHRLEIKLEGLDPNTPYKVKFYAYDNANPQGVTVFTDVTANPLIQMPGANSGDGNFTPGDGSGGTQYAPAGQFIDGTAPVTFPNTNDFRAIELFATSDGTGKLVFAETTVAGLSGTTQVLPVLNGFEIQKDQRSYLSTAPGGSWSNAANWQDGNVPAAKGQVANFGNTTGTSLTIDTPTTLARLNFSGTSLTIDGASTLTLDDNSINSTLSGKTTGRTEINLTSTAAQQTINAPLVLAKDTQVWTSSAAQTLTIHNLQPSAVALTKVGDGTLEVNNVRTNALSVQGGKVTALPNASAAGTSKVASLTIAAAARLDLKDNKLITNSSAGTSTGGTYNGVQGQVQRAYNFGGWDQPGLTTSMPDAIAGLTTIGVATGEQVRGLGPTDTDTFAGQVITGASTIAMYTYAGDANLDGTIDGGDYGIIDNFVQVPNASGYANGDFNYDGVIDGGDYGIIDNNIQAQGAPFETGGVAISGVTVVPEPGTSTALIAGLAAGILRGRRRRG